MLFVSVLVYDMVILCWVNFLLFDFVKVVVVCCDCIIGVVINIYMGMGMNVFVGVLVVGCFYIYEVCFYDILGNVLLFVMFMII